MNKSELVKVLSRTSDFPIRKAQDIVGTVFGMMFSTLAFGERIETGGFGTFTVREYDGHKGRNLKSGIEMAIKPKYEPLD